MSCFVVSDYQFNYIRSGVAKFRANSLLVHLPRDETEWRHVDRMISELVEWNYRAFEQRYPQEADGEFFEVPVRPVPWEHIELVQMLKFCQCLQYQCEDAKGFKDSEPGRWLKNLINHLTSTIIENLTNYRECKWAA